MRLGAALSVLLAAQRVRAFSYMDGLGGGTPPQKPNDDDDGKEKSFSAPGAWQPGSKSNNEGGNSGDSSLPMPGQSFTPGGPVGNANPFPINTDSAKNDSDSSDANQEATNSKLDVLGEEKEASTSFGSGGPWQSSSSGNAEGSKKPGFAGDAFKSSGSSQDDSSSPSNPWQSSKQQEVSSGWASKTSGDKNDFAVVDATLVEGPETKSPSPFGSSSSSGSIKPNGSQISTAAPWSSSSTSKAASPASAAPWQSAPKKNDDDSSSSTSTPWQSATTKTDSDTTSSGGTPWQSGSAKKDTDSSSAGGSPWQSATAPKKDSDTSSPVGTPWQSSTTKTNADSSSLGGALWQSTPAKKDSDTPSSGSSPWQSTSKIDSSSTSSGSTTKDSDTASSGSTPWQSGSAKKDTAASSSASAPWQTDKTKKDTEDASSGSAPWQSATAKKDNEQSSTASTPWQSGGTKTTTDTTSTSSSPNSSPSSPGGAAPWQSTSSSAPASPAPWQSGSAQADAKTPSATTRSSSTASSPATPAPWQTTSPPAASPATPAPWQNSAVKKDNDSSPAGGFSLTSNTGPNTDKSKSGSPFTAIKETTSAAAKMKGNAFGGFNKKDVKKGGSKKTSTNDDIFGFLKNPFAKKEKIVEDASVNQIDTTGMTQRIMTSLRPENQASGAGGQSTYDAFLRTEENWKRLKELDPSNVPQSMRREFVIEDGGSGDPRAWTKLNQQQGKELDFDVAICGGTLGIFFATALQIRGLDVCVVEAGQLQGREQEWNISLDELLELVRLGVLSLKDVEDSVKTSFPACRSGFKNREVTPTEGGYFKNGVGFETATDDVLNLGVSPSILIERAKQRFLNIGGVVKEATPIEAIHVSHSYGTALDLGQQNEPMTARLVLDCMGNASPVTRQQRLGTKPDGVCAVVGSCAEGFDPRSNVIGDIIYTNQEIIDKRENGKYQYFWEAFPVGIGRDGKEPGTSDVKTTYLFTYMDVDKDRISLQTLMDDYWRLLPAYQPSIKNPETDLKFRRVLFAYFPTYKESPLKPAWDRILAVGDASGIQSPLSFGGFGALSRHLGRIVDAVGDALDMDVLTKEDLAEINAYTPNLSAAWMFQKAMSVRMGQKVDPKFVNRLLAVNFEELDKMGPRMIRPFLQDVVRFDGLVASLARSFKADPSFMPAIVSHVGVFTLAEWLGHVGNMGVYSVLDSTVSPLLGPVMESLVKNDRLKFKWRRKMEAWKYGCGNDYQFPP